MRVRLRHEIAFAWGRPLRSLLLHLRLTPRDHFAQHVLDWRIASDVDCRLSAGEDAFGNVTYFCSTEGPIPEFRLIVEGLVLTSDSAGVVQGVAERLPVECFLRETADTAPGPELRRFADGIAAESAGQLDCLHRLMESLHARMDVRAGIAAIPAAEAFEAGQGTSASLAQVMVAAARHMGRPARFVTGYLVDQSEAFEHAWMEAHVSDLGWIAFDPAGDLCPKESHIRIAAALDALGAAPVRSAPPPGVTQVVTSQVLLPSVSKASRRGA